MKASLVTLLLVFFGKTALSADIFVPGDYSTIAEAIQNSSSGDVIILSPLSSPYTVGTLGVSNDITIRGGGAERYDVVLTTSGNGGVFYVTNSTFVLENLIVSQSSATGEDKGGALTALNSEIHVTNVDFSGNQSLNGGAIFCSESDLYIKYSNFYINHSMYDGGAVYIEAGELECLGSRFEGNYTTHERLINSLSGGGAICISNIESCLDTYSAIFDETDFVDNHSILRGGAVFTKSYVWHSENDDMDLLSFEDCEFEGNYTLDTATVPVFGHAGGGAVMVLHNGYADISGCMFDGNTSYDSNNDTHGGAIYDYITTPQIVNSRFEDNQATSGGALYYTGAYDALRIDPLTTVEKCVFVDNTATDSGGALHMPMGEMYEDPILGMIECLFFRNNATGAGGAIHSGGRVEVLSSLFVENSASSGAAISYYIDTSSYNAVVDRCTFTGNSGLEVVSVVGGLYNDMNLTIKNSDLSYNSAVDIGCQSGSTVAAEYSNSYANYNGSWENCASDLGGNVGYDPSYVDESNVDVTMNDYRKKWSSELLDRGDPTQSDFDETRSDIGWSPVYPEVEIGGVTEIAEAGHYRVTSTATLHSGEDVDIPDGTVLKMDGASNLFIADSNPTNGYNITVGDPNGARTSIVGSDSYSSIAFGDNAAGAPVADCSFNGVLFNKLTSPNVPGFLKFSNCNVSLDGDGGNVKFNESRNVELYFAEVCQGDFKNFDFEALQITDGEMGFGWLTIANSDIDLININFDAVPGARDGDTYPWFWKVLHAGTVPGNPDHIIRDCVFPSQDNLSYAIPLYTSGAEFNMHHNQFTEVEVGAISASVATLYMNNGAMNSFEKTNDPIYAGYSIIAGVQAPMDLYCGYNTFVYPLLSTGDMFVEDACASSDWRNNFWGLSCNNPVDPTNFIPACVSNVQPTLSTCPDTFTPCGPQTGSASTLYSLGEAADDIQNYEAACVYWAQLLLDFPDSKYGTSVTGSIKAIGLLTEYGASNYGQIRLDLEAAAVVTEPTNFLLSVFQQCSALCVEARHGDRTAALALLDALLVEVTGNKDAVFLVNAAIAEIGLWEEEGGLSAAGPEMDQARFVRQMQKLRAYQQALLPMGNMERASSEAPGQEATVQAATFQLHGSYPNPFNPVTTIDLDCLGDVPLLLEIYNLAGQRVDVLQQGEIAAGRHLFQWNADKMASGLYLARAEQGSHTATHKLILLH